MLTAAHCFDTLRNQTPVNLVGCLVDLVGPRLAFLPTSRRQKV
jgi:hypothetical protein